MSVRLDRLVAEFATLKQDVADLRLRIAKLAEPIIIETSHPESLRVVHPTDGRGRTVGVVATKANTYEPKPEFPINERVRVRGTVVRPNGYAGGSRTPNMTLEGVLVRATETARGLEVWLLGDGPKSTDRGEVITVQDARIL